MVEAKVSQQDHSDLHVPDTEYLGQDRHHKLLVEGCAQEGVDGSAGVVGPAAGLSFFRWSQQGGYDLNVGRFLEQNQPGWMITVWKNVKLET